MTGPDLAAAAEALAGSSFRLHGRDPATGLDCIGVLAAALSAIGAAARLPNAYSLRNRHLPETAQIARLCGFVRTEGVVEPGDVIMCRVAPCQFHLAIALSGDRFVHAHAGLKRVVITPGPLPWPTLQHWRLPATI